MLKVFIAEDEEIIRLSLRKQLAKLEKEGEVQFVGEASDGDMALSMMQELKPDLLLTDIRMPFMNGLDLARYAKEMLPWLHALSCPRKNRSSKNTNDKSSRIKRTKYCTSNTTRNIFFII